MAKVMSKGPAAPRGGLRRVVLWSVFLTLVFEVVSCVLRFGLELQSTRDTASTVGRQTLGLRIHHGYIGLACIAAAATLSTRRSSLSFCLLVVGFGLLFSDLVHHFVVLWIVTGDPQFDLVYP